LEKLEIALDPELMKRIDEIVELLGYESREELIRYSIIRFLDKYSIPVLKA